ncbi:hypothetical protein EZV62_004707 [Acer yangbiense]|uniref:Association with the SNF1 complex (ASC) domain-containing protein n=1 Tax=Acer yangbiense TaxID=1000413 RepID=A0A5C7IME6_9ROSI|nr:hypothetical protein EZV62_004707 [Acer yangbiense]
MGNVNAREDESSSPSGVEEGESNNSVQEEGMGAPDGLMGQSPPHSPRATHSPLMFTPQVPVVPLQRPDEMHNPSHLWMQNSSSYEDMSNEIGIPTMITWCYDAMEVAVEGSWDNWKTRIPLQRSGKDFTIMKVLPSGVYQYRFIVDGQWQYAPDLPWAQDDVGNAYNILDLQCLQMFRVGKGKGEDIVLGDTYQMFAISFEVLIGVQYGVVPSSECEYVPEDLESISSFEPPQSPELSYTNLQLSAEDFAKEPPMVPPHLQMTLLNVPSAYMEIPPPLSRPQHVVLNHLYMQKGKSSPSVVALGSTHRFLSKYVTVVLYKSMQR